MLAQRLVRSFLFFRVCPYPRPLSAATFEGQPVQFRGLSPIVPKCAEVTPHLDRFPASFVRVPDLFLLGLSFQFSAP
jgi:hypothetical protein